MEIRKNGSLVIFGLLMIVAVLVAFIIGFGSVNVANAEEIKKAAPAASASPAPSATPEATPAAERTLEPTPKSAGSPAAKSNPAPTKVIKAPITKPALGETRADLEKAAQIVLGGKKGNGKPGTKPGGAPPHADPAGPARNVGHREVNAERSRYPRSGAIAPGSLTDIIQKALAAGLGDLKKSVDDLRRDLKKVAGNVDKLGKRVGKLETAPTPTPAPPPTPVAPTPAPSGIPSPAPSAAPSSIPDDKPSPAAESSPAAARPVVIPPAGGPAVTWKWPWEDWKMPKVEITIPPLPAPSASASGSITQPTTPPPAEVNPPPAGNGGGDKGKVDETAPKSTITATKALTMMLVMFGIIALLLVGLRYSSNKFEGGSATP